MCELETTESESNFEFVLFNFSLLIARTALSQLSLSVVIEDSMEICWQLSFIVA